MNLNPFRRKPTKPNVVAEWAVPLPDVVKIGDTWGTPFDPMVYILSQAAKGGTGVLSNEGGVWVDDSDPSRCGIINPRQSWVCEEPKDHDGDKHWTTGPDGVARYDWFLEA